MSLINCPDCQKSISEAAAACPACGFTLSPDIVVAQKQKQKNDQVAAVLIAGGGVLFFAILFAICRPETTSSTSASTQSFSVAEKISVLDYGTKTVSSDIDATLTRLARRFPENKKLIASMTIKGQELLAQRGVDMMVSSILTSVEYSMRDGSGGMSYAEALAAFVTVRTSP